MKRFFAPTLAVAILLVLTACVTPADRWIADHLSAREKAALLVDKGLAAYDRMVEADDFTAAPGIKATLQLALETDPLEPRAPDALKRVDAFLTRRQNETKAEVKTLVGKSSLTDREKYQLVVLVRQLEALSVPGVDLSQLVKQTATIRAEVLKKSVQNLADAEKALGKAQGEPAAGKALAAISQAIGALRAVAPLSNEAESAARRLTGELDVRAKADLSKARGARQAKDYSAATKALDHIEKTLVPPGYRPGPEVADLKYQVSFEWARTLFEARKHGEAASRVGDALEVRVTAEALDLREKINQAASFRDWDAEYEGVDRQLADLVQAGDLKTAWNLVNSTLPKLKKDATKTRLATRQKQIVDGAHELYEEAVRAYSEEDYGEALAGFDTVAAIDPRWKLTKAYLDKARAKTQVLGGVP